MTYFSKNISKKIHINKTNNHKSNKNIIKNLSNSEFENILINMNSSNSSKKEKINNSPNFQIKNYSNKKVIINNLKAKIDNNISKNILTITLKGIISLKKNDIFDYLIKLLKLILYNYKGNN